MPDVGDPLQLPNRKEASDDSAERKPSVVVYSTSSNKIYEVPCVNVQ